MTHVDKPWHADSKGQKKPDELVGRTFVHIKTSHLYDVIGFTFNASTDQWAIQYARTNRKARGEFSFSRDMAEFLDGRFLEVK